VAAGLLDWLDRPSDTRGIRFALDPDGWDLWTYERLAGAARKAGAELVDAGVEAGDVVPIAIPTGAGFIAAYFGTLLAGATPAPLVPPTVFEDGERYVARTADLVRAAGDLVATEPSLAEVVIDACSRAGGVPVVSLDLAERGGGDVAPRPPADLALLQFTSGSSGRPRGVRVGYDNLEANITMIRDWIDWREQDAGAHWLPLYHDMGLIGCTLTPTVYQRDLWIMRPEQFVMNPLRWLERFGRGGAAFTAGPNFAFAYAASKIKPDQVTDMDFSGWRGAIIGAERLDPGVLGRFAAMVEPYGFRREVYLPAYGMAEATLAVSILTPGRVARTVRPDWDAMTFGERVELADQAEVGDDRVGDGAGWLIGCGGPLPGVSFQIVDEDRRALPEGHLGEIRVEGETVAHGYVGTESGLTSFDHGGVVTGDAGFVHDGELYVIGRLGDSVKVRGKTLYAEDLEAKLAAVPDVPAGRCVVLPGAEDETGLVAIVERGPGPWVDEAARVLSREAGREARVRVYTAERGSIMRTSSGKPRRRVMWRAFLDGELQLAGVHDSREEVGAPESRR
jgi:fatty-acyl-CoA synthase